MELKDWLLVLQVFLLGLQLGSAWYTNHIGIQPTKFWYGYPIWGCMSSIAIMLIIWSL